MGWVVLVLALLCVFLLTALLMRRHEIKRIIKQLEYIKSNQTNMLVTTQMKDSVTIKLATELNDVMKSYRDFHAKEIFNNERMKNELTALSHDIRTPLTSLNGYFELLKIAQTEEEREKYSAVIQDRIVSLSDMLEQMFTFTKLQNNSYNFELEKVDIKDLLCDTLLSFYENFKKKNCEPTVSIPDEDVFIISNETAMRRVVQNVIKNALQYGNGDVSVKLYTTEKQVSAEISNSCEDANKIDADRVFDKFYKGDASRNVNSTGLGLSIAKELTEKTGGKIYAKVYDNKFIITITFPNSL